MDPCDESSPSPLGPHVVDGTIYVVERIPARLEVLGAVACWRREHSDI